MEKEKIYLISEASRKVEVESHVLRYWEDELKLPVKRNELGHRYYTEGDIKEFQEIKKLKENGLQLKAIRMILKNGKLTRIEDGGNLWQIDERLGPEMPEQKEEQAREAQTEISGERQKPGLEIMPAQKNGIVSEDESAEKMKRLEYLMKRLISEAVQESNEKFFEEISENLTKELDYQFRMQEERDEQRETRQLQLEEEHYKQLDALLRGRSAKKTAEKKEVKKLFGKK